MVRAVSIIIIVAVTSAVFLIVVHLKASQHLSTPVFAQTTSDGGSLSHGEMERMLQLVKSQNDTITALASLLESNAKGGGKGGSGAASSSLLLLNRVHAKEREIQALQAALDSANKKLVANQQQQQQQQSNKPTVISSSSSSSSSSSCLASNSALAIKPAAMEADCESRYGLSLIDKWRNNKETWCKSEATDAFPESTLICFPYHQAHKKLDGRGPDLFCEATNFFVDFSKVSGEAPEHKLSLGSQYLHFAHGSLSSLCTKTSSFKPSLFMPHHSLQMASFASNAPVPASAKEDYTVEETPTYLLARDEDCENSFHSTADFMNMYLVLSALRLSPSDLQVMLFDKHPDGPYMDLIEKAFAGNRKPLRHQHYKGKTVLFRRLVFHLESPAGLIFPKVSRPDPLRCRDTGLFTSYAKFVLQAFDLWDVPPPAIPHVTLSLRHRTASKNVGRVLANEEAVIGVLKQGNMMTLEVADTAKMPYAQQLQLARKTNVLVGVHGAGLMLILFAANEAVLVELHPSYRQDRHFRHAARMVGKTYMPMRSTNRETCHLSSDNVLIPIDEFRATMDGALRLARSFDDGLSECGLVCPPQILAIDSRLDGEYSKLGEKKGSSINTQFPC